MNFKQFREKMQKKLGGKFINWKEKGKLLFVVHPLGDIGERKMVRYERIVNNDGEKQLWGAWRPYVGEDDFSEEFKTWLDGEDAIDENDIVFRLETAKGGKEYTKAELLGRGKGKLAYQKNMLKWSGETLLCVKDYEDLDKPWGVLKLTAATGFKWWKIVESQIEEYGENEGDYTENPYVFKVTYDKTAKNNKSMYLVERVLHEIPEELLEEMEEANEAPIDIARLCDPSKYDVSQGGTVQQLIKNMLVISCPLLDDLQVEEVGNPDEELKDEEPKPKQKPKEVKKEVKKQQQAKTTKPLELSGQYMYDDEVVTYVKSTKKFHVFKDEDGLKVKVKVEDQDELVPVCTEEEEKEKDPVEQFAEETVKNDVGTSVKECVKGESYYTFDGQCLEFVRYLKTKDKAVFKSSKGEKVQLDGGDFVSPVKSDGPDPLEPIEVSDEEDVCQTCGCKLPAGTKICPDCGALFEIDPEDLPNF